MANRIEKWFNEVLRWKKKFEQFLKSPEEKKILAKDELQKYKRIASADIKDLNIDEKISKRMLKSKIAELEKELYPSRIVRMGHNLSRLFSKIGNVFRNKPTNQVVIDSGKFSKELEQLGIPEREAPKKLSVFEKNISSELVAINEILDTTIVLSNDNKRIEGLELTLKKENGESRQIFLPTSSLINKSQATALLRGKSVFVKDKWLIPDHNDRDDLGNIKFREVTIKDYDIREKLKEIPGLKLNEQDLSEKILAIQQGKSVELNIKIGNEKSLLLVEANPMGKSLAFFKDGKKIPTPFLSKQINKVKPMMIEPSIKPKQNRKSQGM